MSKEIIPLLQNFCEMLFSYIQDDKVKGKYFNTQAHLKFHMSLLGSILNAFDSF